MTEVFDRWRFYAREIEADLGLRGIDIADWHRGAMSSRRLIVLTDGLPVEDSWFRAQIAADVKAFQERRDKAVQEESRRRHLLPAYRNVPKHLWPADLREAVS